MTRCLCEGPDGGVLAGLVAASSESGVLPISAREAASALLTRLTLALRLSPIAERGELLALSAEELGAFEVRGLAASLPPDGRGLYCVVRSGWWLGSFVVDRPLLEPVGPEAQGVSR